MTDRDYYADLGIAHDADAAQVQKAYRKLARQHHPDMSTAIDAEARFKQAAEAYATLKSPERRAAYDAQVNRYPGERSATYTHDQAAATHRFDDMELEDLLASMRHGAHRQSHTPAPTQGRDFESSVRLSVHELHRGALRTLAWQDAAGDITLEITVPPGLSAGKKLRLKGKGGPGRNGGHPGDIYLHIEVVPHPDFRVNQHDLHIRLSLTPWEAALGAEVEVQGLDGPLLLTVPPCTRSGRQLRLRGRGLSDGHGGRGDCYAAVLIDIPGELTVRERELFQALADESHFNPRVNAVKDKE